MATIKVTINNNNNTIATAVDFNSSTTVIKIATTNSNNNTDPKDHLKLLQFIKEVHHVSRLLNNRFKMTQTTNNHS